MNSWVYLFSQFTTEALLFEGFLILVLICGYCAFWVLKRRKFGISDATLPQGPVKLYLNDLIKAAELLRVQLFGINQPNMGALEIQVLEQRKALAQLTEEKIQLEKTLAENMANPPTNASTKSTSFPKSRSSPSVSQARSNDNPAMLQKIKELEAKLFEYSVIEDDLANLKQLRQENILLKSTLAARDAAPSVPEPIAETAPVVETAPNPLSTASTPTPTASPATDSSTQPPSELSETKPTPEPDLVSEFEKMMKS